ncbi:MAG TPA: alpha/beta hydrolase [Nitrososphaerales archaeon]|nr:alpha/beta hydrolase [Nitrososphaerales archaeon]
MGTESSSSNKEATGADLGFVHKFVPGEKGEQASGLTLLMLHGTGGHESDLLPLGHFIAPSASLLSPRGNVLEGGTTTRFFRRFEEGVFDVEDLKIRTAELAEFVKRAAGVYGFSIDRLVAVGYSNGANIAASLLLLKPQILAGAILFRPMVPLVPEPLPDLSGKRVLICSGVIDQVVARSEPEKLEKLLGSAGADVNLNWVNGGHSVMQEEVESAKSWLQSYFLKASV